MESNYILTVSGTIAASWVVVALLGRLIPWCKANQEITCIAVAIPLYLLGYFSRVYVAIGQAMPIVQDVIILIASVLGVAFGAGLVHDKAAKPIASITNGKGGNK